MLNMKRFLIVFSCLFSFMVYGQAQVKNIRAEVEDSGEKFRITYDLDKDGKTALWDISVIATIDGVQVIPSARSLSGDIGQNIKHGRKNTFVWDAYIDVESIDGAVSFDINATPSIIQNPPSTDKLIGMGAAGVGAILVGVGLVNLNNSDVKEYKETCDPSKVDAQNSKDFIETAGQSPCDRLYLKANDATKRGSTLAIIGGVAVAVGSYFLIKKPIYQKWLATQNSIGLHIQPILELQTTYQQAMPGSNIGISLSYTLGK